MSTIVVGFTNLGVPATGLAATIRVRRTDNQNLVVTDAAMQEQGEGGYSFLFTPIDGLDYSIRADGTATLPDDERYAFGSLSGTTEARIETDIPLIITTGGVGPWTTGSGGAVDWTAAERENIRDALGVDGTKTPASGGQLQAIGAAVVLVAADTGTLVVRTVDLAAAIAFFGAALGTPVVHTPGTVTAGAFTWSVVVAGSTVTFTRLT